MSIEIKAYENGPFVVAGRIAYRHGDGKLCPADATALCRCGATQRGPFCDGTHSRIGFRGESFDLTIEPDSGEEVA